VACDIKRVAGKKYSADDKIRIILEGLRGETAIAEICRREGLATGLYYRWSKDFLEAGKKRLQGVILVDDLLIEPEMMEPNRLGDLLASARTPENAFEEGLFALREGDLETARDRMRYWMTNEPGHSKAPAAARILRRVEFTIGSDMGALRDEYLELTASCAEEHPQLSWTARKSAVKCLRYEGLLQEAVAEYDALIDDTEDEVEALFLDTDRLLVQMDIDGHEVDALGSLDARIAANMERVEAIYAERLAKAESNTAPKRFELLAAYPNPFNSSTRFTFSLPEAGLVRLGIYDVSGREVQSGIRHFAAGTHTVGWKAEGLPAGVYFLKAEAANTVHTQKLLLVK